MTRELRSYGKTESHKAFEDYKRLEAESFKIPEIQVVLVSVDSIADLRKAYPNFHADTSEFITAVRAAML